MATPEWTGAELDSEYARAARAGRRAARAEPRATAARYEPSARSLVVELASGASLALPVELLEGLAGAAPEALAAVEVTPGGRGCTSRR